MATLPTNLKDDILDASVNQRRRYNMITNPDGTVEFEDVTVYSQVGSEYGAGLINETNKQINGKVDNSKIVRDLKTIGAMTQEGFIPDALALKEVNESLMNNDLALLSKTGDNTYKFYGYSFCKIAGYNSSFLSLPILNAHKYNINFKSFTVYGNGTEFKSYLTHNTDLNTVSVLNSSYSKAIETAPVAIEMEITPK